MMLRRRARLADGWFPQGKPDEQMQEKLELLRSYIKEAGRDPASFGIEARINGSSGAGNPDEWHRLTEGWRALGATHITISTMEWG